MTEAYGEAAETVLEMAHKPVPKLCALVAYYPERMSVPGAGYPPSLKLVVHIAGSQGFMPGNYAYSYPDAVPGFAEHDLDVFDKVSAGLAWSRSLDVIRKAFEIEVDLEAIWDRHSERTCQSLAFLAIESLQLSSFYCRLRSNVPTDRCVGQSNLQPKTPRQQWPPWCRSHMSTSKFFTELLSLGDPQICDSKTPSKNRPRVLFHP